MKIRWKFFVVVLEILMLSGTKKSGIQFNKFNKMDIFCSEKINVLCFVSFPLTLVYISVPDDHPGDKLKDYSGLFPENIILKGDLCISTTKQLYLNVLVVLC